MFLLFMAGAFIFAGMANALFPQKGIESNRRVIPKVVFLALERLGIVRPRTVRISGYVAISIGVVFLCVSLVLMARKKMGLDQVRQGQPPAANIGGNTKETKIPAASNAGIDPNG
jgi:hypothetical protein